MLMTGIIIGLIMGLTGAGGALIALPLFTSVHGMDLKLASTYSLLAVIFAALFNFVAQRKFTQYRTALLVSAFSLLGSLLAAPYKVLLPVWVMKALLFVVAIFALVNVWRKSSRMNSAAAEPVAVWFSACLGLLLGVLTTYTGLGGGVLMLPLFLQVYRMEQSAAVASSLLAVCLAASFSLLTQIFVGAPLVFGTELLRLLTGLVLAVVVVSWFMQQLPAQTLLRLRQIVFSAVVLFALGKLM